MVSHTTIREDPWIFQYGNMPADVNGTDGTYVDRLYEHLVALKIGTPTDDTHYDNITNHSLGMN